MMWSNRQTETCCLKLQMFLEQVIFLRFRRLCYLLVAYAYHVSSNALMLNGFTKDFRPDTGAERR